MRGSSESSKASTMSSASTSRQKRMRSSLVPFGVSSVVYSFASLPRAFALLPFQAARSFATNAESA